MQKVCANFRFESPIEMVHLLMPSATGNNIARYQVLVETNKTNAWP